MKRKVILYIATSEDGFIAGEGDNLDFLNSVQIEGEDYGYSQFVNSIDTVIVGRKTYEKIISLGYPYHEDKEVYVVTKYPQTSSNDKLHFYSGNIIELIVNLKKQKGKNIYCDGGAELANYLIKLNQIDKIILSVVPTMLNKGTLLFSKGVVPKKYKLVYTIKFKSGLVQKIFEFN